MRRSALTLAAVTILVQSAGLLAQTRVPGPPSGATARAAQPQRGGTQQSGTAILRGRIVAAATGTPVRRAQVRAVAAGTRSSRLVTSDDAGWFEIRELPAGRWELTASKAGFVTMRFGQRRAFESGRPLEVASGAVIERVDFHLPRGAAITGRVFDEFGDPVAGARVQPLRYRWVQGERRLSPAGMTTQTDDTGAFRIFGLMPGEYYVSAVLRALPVDDRADSTAYAPTYYPGTGSAAQAQPVTLGIGEETAVAFGLLAVRTARISGTVVSAAGEPLVNGTVRLQAADGAAGPVAFGGGTRTRADGTFTLTNVAPGSYRLVAMSGNTRRPGGVEYEMGSTSVSVAGDDVAGVTVATARGATLSGTVAVASGSGALPPGNLQVTAPAVGPSAAVAGARPAPVARDGSFRLSGLFDARLVRLNGLPQGWMLESVTVGGRDVTDEGVLFDSSQQVVDARILVTNRITELTGTVTDATGRMATDVAVIVFPEDENRWTPPSRHLRSARPDQQGVFRIGALPPSDRYLAIAVDYLEEGEDTDPEFLRWARHAATSFRLPSGGTVAVSLKVVAR